MKVVNLEAVITLYTADWSWSKLNVHVASVPQEREEAEALWDIGKQSKDEEEAGKTAGTARSQARQQERESRGRVTGGRDELWQAEATPPDLNLQTRSAPSATTESSLPNWLSRLSDLRVSLSDLAPAGTWGLEENKCDLCGSFWSHTSSCIRMREKRGVQNKAL